MIFLLLGQVLGGLILANQFGTNGPLANASIVGAAGELKVPVRAYSGLRPLDLTPLSLLAAVVGAVLVAGPYLRGLMALRRPSLA